MSEGADGTAGTARSHAHGARLTAADAAFLEMETPTQPMHVGTLLVFDPPDDVAARAAGFARFSELVRSRLHRVPRYRQRVVHPPLGLGGPVWIDDRDLDLGYHVRHAALPRPGTTRQLTEYAARVLSRPLDRQRPLWELYVIEGLEDGRLAILTKTHAALIDGLAGTDLVSILLDVEPTTREPAAPPWTPRPTPGPAELARDAAWQLATSPTALLTTGRRLLDTPVKTASRAAVVGRGLVSLARANVARRAPRSLLNQRPGSARRLAVQRLDLQDVKDVKNAFGSTVNDVLLAVVADATGRYLRSREVRTDGLWLRAMVPVATREGDSGDTPVVSVLVDLPMGEMDPVERLRICSEAMAEVVASHRALGAGFLTEMGGFAPVTFHAAASRLAARGRLYNFLVTNVPGPQQPVYCLGARLVGAFPFPPLASIHAYAVGAISTDGWINVGLTGDYDVVPDLERVTGWLVASLQELVRCAEAARARAAMVSPAASGDAAGPDAPRRG